MQRSSDCKWMEGYRTPSNVILTVHVLTLPGVRVVKGIFVTRDRPFFFPVKCVMAIFFLVNRDFHSSREA